MDQLPRLGKRELISLLLFTCNYVVFCLERFPLPLDAWDGLRYFIVALPEPSILLFYCDHWIHLRTREAIMRLHNYLMFIPFIDYFI